MWPPPLPAAPVINCSAVQDFRIRTFRNKSQDHNLALGSERESIGLNRAEQFMLEYWSHSR